MPDSTSSMDAAFLARLQAGDELAYGELVTRWQRPILNFVYRMIVDHAAAEDIAQDVFVRVSRRIGEFRPTSGPASFSTWLFQIARNATLDHLRHHERHPAESLETLADAGSGVAGRTPSPAAQALHAEIGDEIARAVAALPEDQRTALVLAEYHDLPVTEIAAVMECSEKSVESRLYRARQTLRQALAHLL